MSRWTRCDSPYFYCDYWRTRMQACFHPQKVEQFVRKTQFFFVLSTGRCGTVSLAGLLNQIPNVLSLHEPVALDWAALPEAFSSRKKAIHYIASYRAYKMSQFAQNCPAIYVECTPPLLYHAAALKEVFPTCRRIHLIRDGRDVVRSWINRGVYSAGEQRTYRKLMPRADGPFYAEWSAMNQFERCCWLWATHNKWLIEHSESRAIFEQIFADYDEFMAQIADPLGLPLAREQWAEMADIPRNASTVTKFPPASMWSAEDKNTFDRICGGVMRELGYDK